MKIQYLRKLIQQTLNKYDLGGYDFDIHNIELLDQQEAVVALEVYGGDYEDAPTRMDGNGITLLLEDKFDDPFFTLIYRIELID